MHAFLGILFILVCILLIGIILLQKGRGGGLSGAFGGAGGHSAFGSRTGDMFTWITVVLIGLFLLVGSAAVKSFKPDTDAPLGETTAMDAPAETADEQPAAEQPADETPAAEQSETEKTAPAAPATPDAPATDSTPAAPAE